MNGYILGFEVPEEEKFATENGYIFWSVEDDDYTECLEDGTGFDSEESAKAYFEEHREQFEEDYDNYAIFKNGEIVHLERLIDMDL